MKVNIDKTEIVSDDQRKQIASVIDCKVVRRDATREEMKDFIWGHGVDWELELARAYAALTGDPAPEPDGVEEDSDEDLIGDDEDDEDIL